MKAVCFKNFWIQIAAERSQKIYKLFWHYVHVHWTILFCFWSTNCLWVGPNHHDRVFSFFFDAQTLNMLLKAASFFYLELANLTQSGSTLTWATWTFFVVERRAIWRWNRLGPYFWVMSTPKYRYVHTSGTSHAHIRHNTLKQFHFFDDFDQISFMCLMCAHNVTWGCS